MSDSKEVPKEAPATSTTPVEPAKPPPKKGYSNPALQAMGIKSIKLPSRNWMIFLSVVSVAVGGVLYDKHEQSKIREEYINRVKSTSEVPMGYAEKPRKLRIYVVPPPNELLVEGLRYFRKFVKPILNASGLAFEIFTEERQGDIRFAVAEEIRKIRRVKAGLPENEEDMNTEKQAEEENSASSKLSDGQNSVLKMGAVPIPALPKIERPKAEVEETKSVSELYTPKDLLGINFNKFPFLGLSFEHDTNPKIDYQDSHVEDPRDAGGVICIGRGAYKEYINGVHEGLLGPLTRPSEEEYEAIQYNVSPKEDDDSLKHPDQVEAEEEKKRQEEKEKKENPDAEVSEKKKIPPVTKPYIMPNQYKNSTLAPELDLTNPTALRDENGIPYFFIQPIAVVRNYSLLGFMNTPTRIYRFYNKREQALESSETAYNAAMKKYRPMTMDDMDLYKEEESDWPAKWVQKCTDYQNEWCREFKGDARVIEVLSIYGNGSDSRK